MRIIVGTFVLLSLYAFVGADSFSNKATINTIECGELSLYEYSSEGTGYSDIQKLYNLDSTIKVPSFFFRSNLQSTHLTIHCKIKKTIIASEANLNNVCFEILEPNLVIENNTLPVFVEGIKKEIIRPVFADISAEGNILSIKMDSSISYITAGILKNIISNTEAIILPEKNLGWQITEENYLGLFKANYKLVRKSADSIEYLKTNIGYEKIKSAKKGQKFIPENNTVIITNPSGKVQRINISETLITVFDNDTIVASGSRTQYKLLSTSIISHKEQVALKQLKLSKRYMQSVALSDAISEEEINRMAYKNTLANDNFETLTKKLKLVSSHDQQFESDLVSKFRALAWLSNKDCSKMAGLLKNAAPKSTVFRIISHALAAVKTSFSINEIARIVANRKTEEAVLVELLPVLATTTQPTGKAADIVKELAFSKTGNSFIASTAQLTLGGIAKNLFPIDSKEATDLTNDIIKNMKKGRDTLQQLLVYGNTGSALILPIVLPYISDTTVSNEIRKSAVFATRWINQNEVTALLGNLTTNKDTTVAKAANETLSFRKEYLNVNN